MSGTPSGNYGDRRGEPNIVLITFREVAFRFFRQKGISKSILYATYNL